MAQYNVFRDSILPQPTPGPTSPRERDESSRATATTMVALWAALPDFREGALGVGGIKCRRHPHFGAAAAATTAASLDVTDEAAADSGKNRAGEDACSWRCAEAQEGRSRTGCEGFTSERSKGPQVGGAGLYPPSRSSSLVEHLPPPPPGRGRRGGGGGQPAWWQRCSRVARREGCHPSRMRWCVAGDGGRVGRTEYNGRGCLPAGLAHGRAESL